MDAGLLLTGFGFVDDECAPRAGAYAGFCDEFAGAKLRKKAGDVGTLTRFKKQGGCYRKSVSHNFFKVTFVAVPSYGLYGVKQSGACFFQLIEPLGKTVVFFMVVPG